MIKLLDNYYLKGDANCYTLTQEVKVKDKIEYRAIAYYTTIQDLIIGLIKMKSREYINKIDLQTIQEFKKYQEELLEKIKTELGSLDEIKI